MGHMDPFIQVEMNGQVRKTTAIDDGGKRPVWNQSFDFEVKSIEDVLKFTCFDEDVFSNDLVGDCTLPLMEVCGKDLEHQSAVRKWITLFFKGKKSAEIQIDVKYIPPSGERWANDADDDDDVLEEDEIEELPSMRNLPS